MIDELISPLRYDVLVRSQFFEFLAANRPLFDASPEKFVAAVRRNRLPPLVPHGRGACHRHR